MGQQLLALNRDWLLRLLKSQPLDGRRPIPVDATITSVDYLPLTQDILLTIASEAFDEHQPGNHLDTQRRWI